MILSLKKPLFAALLVACALASAGCQASLSAEGTGINVVATTTQIGALTRAVAGGGVRLTVLLPSGADAHDFEPSPQSLRAVHHSRLVLRNGLGLDDWLTGMIENAGGDPAVVVVTEGITPRIRASGEGAGEPDPHVWQDPDNAKVMVENIVRALSAADPEHAAEFTANGEAYKRVLDDTDRQVRELIDSIPPPNRRMVTNHDAFGYFIDHYGLTYVGAIFPVSSKEGETSARQLADLSALIKREGVKAVFAEEELDASVARGLANDTGVLIVTGLYADSLGPEGSGADTIDGMLLTNARKIAEALR